MNKTGNIAVPSEHDTPTREQAQYASRPGKAQAQVAATLEALVRMFMAGGEQARLMGQSGAGVEFQKLNPTVRIYSQQMSHENPLIEIEVDDFSAEDSSLEPGFEFNAKRRRIVQRESGQVPVKIKIVGRSSSETTLMVRTIRKIFGTYVHRLYRGIIYNPGGNWQLCFPKTLALSLASEEVPQNAQGMDESYYTYEMEFELYYDSAYVEEKVKQDAVVVPGELPLRLIDTGVNNQVYLGERRNVLVQRDRKLLTYYLKDSSCGRLFINDDHTRILFMPLKQGPAIIVAKTEREETSLELEVVI